MSDQVKSAIDGATIVVTIGGVYITLPTAAAILSILWTSLRIGEWAYRKIKSKKETDDG